MDTHTLPDLPLEDFAEEEIHLIIEEFFRSKNYKVINLHRIQKSEERGCDLIVEKNDRKIAIAVKIKPRAKDRAQLEDLSKRDEQEKWYVYIQDPTPRFIEKMNELKDKGIVYLSKSELCKKLFSLNNIFYLTLLLHNCKFSRSLIFISEFLTKIYNSIDDYKKPSKSQEVMINDILKTLWRLKDDAATLNKSLGDFQMMFEYLERRSTNLSLEQEISFLKAFLNVIESYLEKSNRLLENLKRLCKSNHFVNYVIYETQDRSNWLGIISFRLLAPRYLQQEIEDARKAVNTMKRHLNINRLPDSDIESKVLSLLAEYCRKISNFAWCIEEFIDDLFYYLFPIS